MEKELERLENLDIIEKVTGPTPWVSPIVVVPKSSGQVRLCVDMQEPNKAVKHEKHLMPTIDDLVADVNGATVFSKLDFSSGYHQLELEPESSHITTFSTHEGLRRYKCLMIGCKNISNGIIVYRATMAEHDQNLYGVLTRLQQHDVRLNKEKCSFSKSEVTFYGHILSSEGLRADPEKIGVITNRDRARECEQSQVVTRNGPVRFTLHPRVCYDHSTVTSPYQEGDTLAVVRQTATCV